MADLSFHRGGTGRPLVLIHGIGSHWQVWSPILDRLAQHRDVIALDLPGFGSSPQPPHSSPRPPGTTSEAATDPQQPGTPTQPPGTAPQPPSAPSQSPGTAPQSPGASSQPPGTAPQSPGGPSQPLRASAQASGGTPRGARPGSVPWFADRVADLLDDLDLPTPDIAGSSLGGGVALELGRRGRARSVTAFAPVGFWSTPGRIWCQTVVTTARTGARRLSRRLPAIMNNRASRAAFCAVFYARPSHLNPDEALAAAQNLATCPGFTDARNAFAHLPPWTAGNLGALPDIPVTIAWGTKDAVLPYNQSRQAQKILPKARHITLPKCGHLPFADDPTRCAEILLNA
ncbi:alpha/beta fold hydrolase [Actinoplanes sp. NPDC023714]|uniref:alpha/beta fold hydrolase n=1 Tax=Actinoplanes sp. NPDC023714 TaxID=3154322 RepID=UPI0033D18B81